MNYRHHSAISPDLYNYHTEIISVAGAYIYHVSFALDPELTERFNASGSAPSVAACLDDITTWREGVLNNERVTE